MNADQFFNEQQREELLSAIKHAEEQTSGEIRLHVENFCKTEVLDRAAFVFEKLQMHTTTDRNGVLFYIAVKDRKFAIIGDSGINHAVPANFWESVKEEVLASFAKEAFAEGLSKGIRMAGEKLKIYFPRQTDDINELPDDISFE
ncbi:MAG: TPM domain-containing protein [Bacteroidota bacterium]